MACHMTVLGFQEAQCWLPTEKHVSQFFLAIMIFNDMQQAGSII